MMSHQLDLWHNWPLDDALHPQTAIKAETILDVDGEVSLYRNFFSLTECDRIFDNLNRTINWRQDSIKLYGKSIPLPRLEAWYGDSGKSYTYSGIEMMPEPWTPMLEIIKSRIEIIAGVRFNSVLMNLYRDGRDSVAWHSDDEPELGQNPVIGSVSFGGTRRFCFRHKQRPNCKAEVALSDGSFLLMGGETQHFWLHQVPKTKQAVKPRINLTFRVIC